MQESGDTIKEMTDDELIELSKRIAVFIGKDAKLVEQRLRKIRDT